MSSSRSRSNAYPYPCPSSTTSPHSLSRSHSAASSPVVYSSSAPSRSSSRAHASSSTMAYSSSSTPSRSSSRSHAAAPQYVMSPTDKGNPSGIIANWDRPYPPPVMPDVRTYLNRPGSSLRWSICDQRDSPDDRLLQSSVQAVQQPAPSMATSSAEDTLVAGFRRLSTDEIHPNANARNETAREKPRERYLSSVPENELTTLVAQRNAPPSPGCRTPSPKPLIPFPDPFATPKRGESSTSRRPRTTSLNSPAFKTYASMPDPTMSYNASQHLGNGLSLPWYYISLYKRIDARLPLQPCHHGDKCVLFTPAIRTLNYDPGHLPHLSRADWVYSSRVDPRSVAREIHFESDGEQGMGRRSQSMAPGVRLREILYNRDGLRGGSNLVEKSILPDNGAGYIKVILQGNGLEDKTVRIPILCDHGILTHRALGFDVAFEISEFYRRANHHKSLEDPRLPSCSKICTTRVRLESIYQLNTEPGFYRAKVLLGIPPKTPGKWDVREDLD